MNENYNIDSEKISLHPKRVIEILDSRNEWEKAKKIYPIYVEISPVGACNHRCTFCSVDYIGYKTRTLEFDKLASAINSMSEFGVKSIMFAGEGEPTLYKKLPEILDLCKEKKIDTSLTTNMVPFTLNNTENFVKNCTWIKVSINAGTKETYSKIHKTNEKDFNKVLINFERAVEIKHRKGYKCTIGGQILLLPENKHEVIILAEKLKAIGVDYLVVKPYTQSLYGLSRVYEGIQYDEYMPIDNELEKIRSNNFSIIFREKTMQRLSDDNRGYNKCHATPFAWAYIMASGDLYGCSAYLQNEKFLIGNINNSNFNELWESKKRQELFEYVNSNLDISKCRINCRMDSVNRYLDQIINPSGHDNFI